MGPLNGTVAQNTVERKFLATMLTSTTASTVPQNSLNSPDLLRSRRALLSLTLLNVFIYLALLIPLPLCSEVREAAFSVPIIAAYSIVEIILFFGCQAYNWTTTLIFRIIFLLHDLAYFITYCTKAAFYGNCDLASCIFFYFTIAIGIAILVVYSQFPKYGCCHSEPLPQPQVILMNGQTVAGTNQQFYVVQNPHHIHGQVNPSFVPQIQMQPAVMQPAVTQSTQPATISVPSDQPPTYESLQSSK